MYLYTCVVSEAVLAKYCDVIMLLCIPLAMPNYIAKDVITIRDLEVSSNTSGPV